MGLLICLINFFRVTFWRLVLLVRGGGTIGRGCKFQGGVVLASGRGRPIRCHPPSEASTIKDDKKSDQNFLSLKNFSVSSE